MRFTGLCIAMLLVGTVHSTAHAQEGTETASVDLQQQEAFTVSGVGLKLAQDAPPPAATEPEEGIVTETPPPAPTAVLPEASETAVPAARPSPYPVTLKEAISEDLIDLSGLRSALDQPVEAQVLRLTLDEAIQLALQNNPDILIAEYDPAKAEAETYAARGEFDPIVSQKLNYSDSTASLDQTVRSFVGILGGVSAVDSRKITSETALAGKLQFGTQYAVQFSMDYEESTFGNYQGEYGGTLGFTLTQPVLRGFGRGVNRIRIRAGENLRKISEARAKLTVLDKMAETIKAYWDLVGATEAARVYEEALRNAERLLKLSEIRRDIGTSADIDVLQAKAGVAMRQSELIQANARIADVGDALKLLLNLKEGDRFSKIRLMPLDRPNPDASAVFDTDSYDQSLDVSVERALAMRPENEMTDLEIANALMEEEKAKNDRLPQLDFIGAYAQGGRDIKMGKTLTGIIEGQDSALTVGVQASVPIGNRAARGAHQRARLNIRQAEERRKQAQMAMMMRVHFAARSVMTSKVLLESTHQTVRLQEANVNAEERRLQIGITTSYQVLRVQEDLTAAQAQELQARIAFEKALVELQLAEGSLLDNFGITYTAGIVESPGSPAVHTAATEKPGS